MTDERAPVEVVDLTAKVLSGYQPVREQCRAHIDNIRNDRPRGKGNRPWWTRACKRWAVPGEHYCWQHLDRR